MRTHTPDRIIERPDGSKSTRLAVKRACNGCGNDVGDVSVLEIEASIDGRPLPDVRGECPWCADLLAPAAWRARTNAHLHGRTAVGAAVLSAQGNIHAGCNVEHRFRAHDVHAEVNALTSMIAAGDGPAVAIVIAADREQFTPCGGCLDWIFELGGPGCLVAFQRTPGAPVDMYRADELMPKYPC